MSEKHSFRQYYYGTITSPARTFALLINDKRMVRFGAYAVLITALLYTLVYFFLVLGGGQPFKPWLNIPDELYYRYNVFFCAPSMLLGWILAAGLMHFVGSCFSQRGSFEQTLAVLGFGISIASWSTGIHDLLTSFLGAIHVIDQRHYEYLLNSPTIWRTLLWVQMSIYLVWFIFLFAAGARTVYQIRQWQAILLGITGFVTYQGFFLVFNR